jgi:hypothetical protein
MNLRMLFFQVKFCANFNVLIPDEGFQTLCAARLYQQAQLSAHLAFQDVLARARAVPLL